MKILRSDDQTLLPESLFDWSEVKSVERLRAEVIEPLKTDDDVPLKFRADLVTAVSILVMFTHLPCQELLRLRVSFLSRPFHKAV